MKLKKNTTLLILFTLLAHYIYGQHQLVGKIEIVGTNKTNPKSLEKLIRLKKDMVLDSLLIAQDITRLKRLPSIANAHFKIVESDDERYNVSYQIEENQTLIPGGNFYTSTNDEFAFRIGLQEFNLTGNNIILGGFYQYDIYNSIGLHLRAPYLFSRKWGGSGSFKNLTTQEPVFLQNGVATYKYNITSFEISGIHEIDFKNIVELGFNVFSEDYSYLSGSTSFDVPRQLKVSKHLIKLNYYFDGISYDYFYLEGFRSQLNLQHVGSNDLNLPPFWIGFNDFSYFKRIGPVINWASRLRLGLASNLETPFAPFSVDNNLNIRGVGNTIDRGTGAIVLNTELRYTLWEKGWFALQGNGFIDAGSWRNPGGEFSDFADSRNFRIYPGLGLRFIRKTTFNAIFRIDYGYGITKNASKGIVFGIGQYF
jgi:outer membrane protein assembly factor BamA